MSEELREDCEWNPTDNRAAMEGDKPHAPADLSVGANGKWHLCHSCAGLAEFAGYRRRVPLRAVDVVGAFLARRVELRRKQLDQKRQYGAGRAIDFDIGEPYVDVVLVPSRRCTVQTMDIAERGKGKVAITFTEPRNYLHAILYTVEV